MFLLQSESRTFKTFFLSSFILSSLYLTHLTPDKHKIMLFFSASVIVAGMDAFVVTVFVGIRTKYFSMHS